QVVPAQGGQPGARGKARAREHEPQDAFEGQSFQDADCHLNAQAGDVGARRSDDLHRAEPGWLFFRQQYDGPSLIELDPPDLAFPHVSSSARDGRQMLRRPPLEVMQPCLLPERPPRINSWTYPVTGFPTRFTPSRQGALEIAFDLAATHAM